MSAAVSSDHDDVTDDCRDKKVLATANRSRVSIRSGYSEGD